MDIKSNIITIVRVCCILNTVIFGFLAWRYFLPPYREHIYLTENGTELVGVVTSLDRSDSVYPSVISLIQYEVDGHSYIYRFAGRRTVGNDVFLLINPDNPENVRLKEGSGYRNIFFVFTIISISSLFLGFIFPWNKYFSSFRENKNG